MRFVDVRSAHTQGAALVIAAMVCQEVGASVAVTLFPVVGPFGAVALRLLWSAILLSAVARPAVRGHSARAWMTAAGYGLALTGINVCFYLALDRLPSASWSPSRCWGR